MTTADILGWIGNVGFLLGAVYIARNNKTGFYWQIQGNILYLFQGHILHLTSLVILSAILIVINVYGIYHWNKYKNKGEVNVKKG